MIFMLLYVQIHGKKPEENKYMYKPLFCFQFSKSRRQRIVDKRVAKNMPHLQSAQAQLDQLQLDREEIQRMSKSSTDFFVCTLSLNNIKDILLDSDKDDAIGFGLAVRRQEHVLDAPTLVSCFKNVWKIEIFVKLQYK